MTVAHRWAAPGCTKCQSKLPSKYKSRLPCFLSSRASQDAVQAQHYSLRASLVGTFSSLRGCWARIFILLSSIGIDSKESISPAYAAWRASTRTPIPTRFLAPMECLKIPALVWLMDLLVKVCRLLYFLLIHYSIGAENEPRKQWT